MIYAVTKEDFKKKLVGIAKDLQANSLADVNNFFRLRMLPFFNYLVGRKERS